MEGEVEQSGKTGRFPASRRVEPKQTTLKKYSVAEIYPGIYFFSVVCLGSPRRDAGKRPRSLLRFYAPRRWKAPCFIRLFYPTKNSEKMLKIPEKSKNYD
eukprot:sb/3478558/